MISAQVGVGVRTLIPFEAVSFSREGDASSFTPYLLWLDDPCLWSNLRV